MHLSFFCSAIDHHAGAWRLYQWTCSTTLLAVEQVLQNTEYFAVSSGSFSKTEVFEKL